MNLSDKAKEIRSLLLQNEITLDEAKEMLKPIVDEANTLAQKIAKKFGRKRHHGFSVIRLLR